MKLTPIRLILITMFGALLLAAGACASLGESDGGTAGDGQDAFEEPRGAADYVAAPEGAPAVVNSSGETAADGTDLQGLLDRKIVQSTSIDLEVEEVGRNFQDIIRLAEVNQGYVVSSSFSNVDDEQIADVTIRVPGDRYQAVLQELRGMGEVVTEGSDSSDVTEEYTDLDARLRTLEATEQRYLELLAEADNVSDILAVQDRLDVVRGEIELVQGRINVLDNLTELATITAHLRPLGAAADGGTGGGGPHPIEAAQNAWDASLSALRGIAAAALVVAVFSWWLVPPLAAGALGARWLLARRPKAPASTPV
jgi:hypothetical protein